MYKFIAKIIVLVVLFCQAVYLSPAEAYKPDVHKKITENAALKSLRIKPALEAAGLLPQGKILEEIKIKDWNLNEWIQHGSDWEDGMALSIYGILAKRGVLYCHFYNPITDKGLTDSEGEEIGQSLIDRANDPEELLGYLLNEWSYGMAKKLYYTALTGDARDINENVEIMRDGHSLFNSTVPTGTNISQEERERFYAWTLQALGHTLHLIQDASVPAHTRNDLHGILEPFESWTYKNREYLLYDEEGLEPWTFWNLNPSIKVPDVFIDASKLLNATTPPITDLNQGLAEYSHANFLSADTVFSDGNPNSISTIHGLADVEIADLGNLVFKEDREIDSETYSFYYVKNNTAQIDHFALCGIAWHIKQMEFMSGQMPDTNILFTVDDPKVNEDYGSKLVPRAVGYSAGLLDYFFRGQIEVLALTPFSENDGFGLRLRIKNVTPTQEAMIKGDEQPFSLIWRYTPEGANPDGSEDAFVTATSYTCREGNCDEIQYGDNVVIDFYFPWDDGIEIYELAENLIDYTLVFKGTLGVEESAVIGKSINRRKGQLESTCLPLFFENASYGLRIKIKNVTPTEEAMIKGDADQFDLVCRFTPEGANPDGSEDKFVTAVSYNCLEGNCDYIQYEDEVTVDFYLPWEEENRIGMQIYESAEDSVKCMLTFNGKLGEEAEEAAVAGKDFTLGQNQIRFNEEWDNGLTGNYAWEHTLPNDPQNPDNGTTSNAIAATASSSNSLIKDNVRYAGYDTARINETSLDFNDEVTPYTYLQFKIDDLSKTESATFHWQAMVLYFNEGRILQMTQSGQGYAINGTTATCTFELGANLSLNIFELFQNAGISIPDPFYIESIDFMQQLFQESQPPATETSQHMEVDYIRLIEEKQEE
jgi:hypothetical protein